MEAREQSGLGVMQALGTGLVAGALSASLTQAVLVLEYKLGVLKVPNYEWMYYNTTFAFITLFCMLGFVVARKDLFSHKYGWLRGASAVVIIFALIQLVQLPSFIGRGGALTAYTGSSFRSLLEIMLGLIPATFASTLFAKLIFQKD